MALVVAKKGQATAAVSTALGSNIFDILIALGLPWALYLAARGSSADATRRRRGRDADRPRRRRRSVETGGRRRYASTEAPVHIHHAVELTCIMALSTVVFLLFSVTNNWTYTARHGLVLLFLYFLFNVYVVLDAIPAANVPGPSGI